FAALFGLFSTENAVILPAAMLLYDITFRARRPFSLRSVSAGYLAVASAMLTTWWLRDWVFSKLPPFEQPFVDNPLVGADFLTARLTALKVVSKYIWLLIWPQWLSWDYSYNQIPPATFGAGLAALTAVAVLLTLVVWLYRSHPQASFFGAFFFLALMPCSNLVLIIGSIMAERFLYVPSIGFAGCLVAGVLALCQSLVAGEAHRVRMAAAALAVIVAGLGLRT